MGEVINMGVRTARQSSSAKDAQDIHARSTNLRNIDRPLGVMVVLLACAGWWQHLYTCFTEGLWALLIAGAVIPPIGMINGWSIWLGW